MEMKSKISNSYKRVTIDDGESDKKPDASSLMLSSRLNEKYGATNALRAATALSDATPVILRSSFAIVYLSVLTADMTRGILFPTMWLFVLSLGGNKSSQGAAIACFSFGRAILSPVFGSLSETYGHRKVLIGCNIIIALGALLYSFASSFFVLALGQLVMGMGSGSLGVTRSYVAEHSPQENRTTSLAFLTAAQYFGFTVTPVFGAILAAIGSKNRFVVPLIRLSVTEYSLPALFMGCLALGNAALLYYFFNDNSNRMQSDDFQPIPTTANGAGTIVTVERGVFQSEPKMWRSWIKSVWHTSSAVKVVVGGCLMNVAFKGTIGVFETLGSEFVTRSFKWDSLHTGYTFALFGAMGVFCLLCFPILQMLKVSDLDLIAGGGVLMTVSCFLLSAAQRNIHVQQFYVSLTMMYVFGYPIASTALLGATSKVCGDGPQGSAMGWFAASGSLARIIFPLTAGILAENFNDGLIFAIMGVILLISSFVIIFFRYTIASIIDHT